MKQSSLTIFFAAFMTALFSACSDDFGDMEIPTEELYTRAFIKEFGIFDANHTWCAATPTSITINPQTLLNDVKVYSKTDGKYYYVAHYTDVYKSTTITFDAPRGTTDLKIIADGTTYYAQAGTTLTVSGGRASRTIHTTGDAVVSISISDTPLYFNAQQLLPILSTPKFPSWTYYDIYGNGPYTGGSTGSAYGMVPEQVVNLNSTDITQNFYFISNGQPFIIYPIYWSTADTHTLGIYYYANEEDEEPQMVDLYTDKTEDINSNDESKRMLSYRKKANNTITVTKDQLKNKTSDVINTIISEYNEICENDEDKFTDSSDLLDSNDDYIEAQVTKLIAAIRKSPTYGDLLSDKSGTTSPLTISSSGDLTIEYYEWVKVPNFGYDGGVTYSVWNSGIAYDVTTANALKSQGLEITIPNNTKFGFYIKLHGGGKTHEDTPYATLFSEEDENKKNNNATYVNSGYTTSAGTTLSSSDPYYTYAATYIHPENNRQFFSFEDWTLSGDFDFNDLIFVLSNAKSMTYSEDEKVFDEETYEWLICAEDLGTTDDFDFNDVIVKVKYDPDKSSTTTGSEYSCVEFTAMAAGGTLPIELHFDGTIYADKASDSSISDGVMYPDGCPTYTEFHKWFGSDGSIPSSTMINTYATTGGMDNQKGRTCTLYVSGSFSLSATTGTTAFSATSSLKDFYITVSGTSYTSIIAPKLDADSSAPQMFVIEDKGPNNDTYQWPTERTKIQDAYPSAWKDENDHDKGWETIGFITWTNNQTTGADWHKSSSRNNTCRLWGGVQDKPTTTP